MHRKYSLNEHVFDNIDTPQKAYWLGYMYGDGSINVHGYDQQVSCSSAELDPIQKFHDFLETNRPTYIEHRKVKLNGYHYDSTIYSQRVHSKSMVQALAKCGIIPNKTYDHSVPVYIPPEPLTRHYWRGLFDAEGTISPTDFKSNGHVYKYYSVKLVGMNKPLLQQFEKFVGIGGISPHPTSENVWSIGPRPEKTILPLLNRLYEDIPENIRLERKYQIYLQIKNHMQTEVDFTT